MLIAGIVLTVLFLEVSKELVIYVLSALQVGTLLAIWRLWQTVRRA